MTTTPTQKINMIEYFKNLNVFYVLNIYVKLPKAL